MKNKALCPRCNKHETTISPTYGMIHCKECRAKDKKIMEAPEFSTLSMQTRIVSQRDKHLGDIAQPWDEKGNPNPVFVKANEREVVEDYFTKEQLKEAGL